MCILPHNCKNYYCNLIFGQILITRALYEANWNYLCKRNFGTTLQDNDRVSSARQQRFYEVGGHAFQPKIVLVYQS
ncbi:hypothetical protein F441_08175 [Phytophthora nicotianae CJ01A1]|uniref:Uncharacterized protein n=3 Tax=Phytophthora nicotianae TaxID=4792 RepID=W2Q9G9_PHYN3|nr:hypothetical protein PPTG_22836 [Phytophthora nicotianae INRA-310]ETK87534.1 hypothetical protein L915_08026 [Phytophthora nicotianae]ETP17405.1 hypothetical protein F441_08175 [Phytophthora nicotianae CJ01A1]ETL94121.1 hypothetical protein L917_07850 [Phytophthora nicotianae]ETM47365.1 hypothetical protein L914_07912 [Phytophthora nicotianae]ETN09813.1 hypothetical protein PPTG_22836 [Phytophthora nicotianae INRA-310]